MIRRAKGAFADSVRMTPFSTRQSRRSGLPTISVWRNGIWLTRFAVVLGLLVIVFGVADVQLLRTPVVAFLAIIAVGGALVGIVLCLWGVHRRSKRWRSGGFWIALVASVGLIGSLSFMYARALYSPNVNSGTMAHNQP